MPSLPHLAEPLTDGQVAVRDYAERDIPEILIAYQDDPELHLRLGLERPPSGAELGRLAEQEPGERVAGVRATLTVLEGPSDVCCGQIDIHRVEWEHERADLAIWLAPQVRGRGIAARALRLSARWLLENSALERVQALVDPANAPMLHAARRAGFTEEGTYRAYTRGATGRVDAVVLSLVPGDLRA